jgi:glycosyltransferase involved in cell wall biosynthesis
MKKLKIKNSHSSEALKILVMAHNHPVFFPGGGEIMAYDIFNEIKGSKKYQINFLAATGAISRRPHNGTCLLGVEGAENEYLFYNDAYNYLQQSNLQPEILNGEFADLLVELAPDIIHMHHILRFGVEMIALIKNKLPNSKIILTLHDFIPICHRDGQMLKVQDNQLCEKSLASSCNACFPEISEAQFSLREYFIKTHFEQVDAFVSPSYFLAERYVQWGLPQEKIHIIENGTKPSVPAPPRKLPYRFERNQFAFLGQISLYKGVMILLDAVNILARLELDFHVNIYGNISLQTDEFKASFNEKCKQLEKYVSFHGRYAPEQLPQIMQRLDWLIMPSIWWENAPLVISEAHHHGRPVICSNIGGMKEFVEHDVSGLHFQAGSASSLADAMQRGLNENNLWNNLRDKITKPASNLECSNQYLMLFESLIS